MILDKHCVDKLIDRNSPEPLYLQVSKILENVIRENYKPNTRLPSEDFFIEMFKVSRPTVSSAISFLIQKGILRKDKGKGTYVNDTQKIQLIEINEIETIMQYEGHQVKNLVLELDKVSDAGDFAYEALKIAPKEQLVLLKRVRYVDDEPIYISTCYFPEKYYAYLREIDFSKEFLYKSLGEKFKINIVKVERLIRVAGCTLEEIRYLDLTNLDDPILEIKGTSYDLDNKPVLCSIAKFDASKVCVRGTVWVNSTFKNQQGLSVN